MVVQTILAEASGALHRCAQRLHEEGTDLVSCAERALVAALGGGCQTPIGALASPIRDDRIELVATVVSLDGSREIRGHALGARDDAAALGARVGAGAIDSHGGGRQCRAGARTRPGA